MAKIYNSGFEINTMKAKEFKKRQDAIYKIHKKNKKLIEFWRSIPWWKFWQKPSLEEQREIIINNWKEIYTQQ